MTQTRLRLPWTKRARGRRAARPHDEPSVVFKTFVQVLAQMRDATRETNAAAPIARRENG